MWRVAVVFVSMMVACGGDKDDESTAPASAECSDPSYNPWAGTCVETFHEGCFDPSGACEGTLDQASGATVLEWDNGAAVEVSINFATLGAETDIISSTGEVCSTGQTQNNVGDCASQTIYTRASDGAQMTFCIYSDQSMDVTCPDGSVVSADASQQQGANDCQYGGDAEACTFEGLTQ